MESSYSNYDYIKKRSRIVFANKTKIQCLKIKIEPIQMIGIQLEFFSYVSSSKQKKRKSIRFECVFFPRSSFSNQNSRQ